MFWDRRQMAGVIGVAGIVAVAAFGLGLFAQRTWDRTKIAKLETDNAAMNMLVSHLNDRPAEQAVTTRTVSAFGSEIVSEVLSADAEELLRMAAKDQHGQIYVTENTAAPEVKGRRMPAIPSRIRTAEREFCVEQTARSFARWRAALEELSRQEIVEPIRSDGVRTTYRLTQTGYRTADRLPADGQVSR